MLISSASSKISKLRQCMISDDVSVNWSYMMTCFSLPGPFHVSVSLIACSLTYFVSNCVALQDITFNGIFIQHVPISTSVAKTKTLTSPHQSS
jgi:hypothetical protein